MAVVTGQYCALGEAKLKRILTGMSAKNIVDANSVIMKLRLDLEESDFNFSNLWQGNYKIVITDSKDYIICNLADKSIGFLNEDGLGAIFDVTYNVLQELENDLYEMYYNKEYGIKLLIDTFCKCGRFRSVA